MDRRRRTNIVLQSGTLVIDGIVKNTKAKFFSELHEGDQIEIFHTLESTTGGSGGNKYASYFKVVCYNRPSVDKITLSGNELVNRLANFEVKPL